MGKDERTLLEMSKRQNMPLPERIKNAPDLLPGLELYYDAFKHLTTSRQIGQGCLGPIAYKAISDYCQAEGIEGDMREDMLYHIEHLDAAYMSWQTNKAKFEAEQAEKLRKRQQQMGR